MAKPKGPRLPEIRLTAKELETLEGWIRGRKTAQSLAERARIVLACTTGWSNSAIAREMGLSRPTVARWRRRFLNQRIEGLLDQPRTGAPSRITDAAVQRVIELTLGSVPTDGTRWSTRSMSLACGLSQSAVSRVWRAFSLRPEPGETVKLSNDPAFGDRVSDIVGLYLNSPDRLLALCVDEAAGLRRECDRASLSVRSGQLERGVQRQMRDRTETLLQGLDAADRHIGGVRYPRQRASELRRFLSDLDSHVPGDLEIHLIFGYRGTHKTPLIQRWLAGRPRYRSHFTSAGASWLKTVECWFELVRAKQVRNGSCATTQVLAEAVQRHFESSTAAIAPFSWTRPASTSRRSSESASVNELLTHRALESENAIAALPRTL